MNKENKTSEEDRATEDYNKDLHKDCIPKSEMEEDYIKWVLAPSLKDYKGKIPFYKYKEKAEVIILKYQD